MYYKIENTECEVYKRLHELRTYEERIGKENYQAVQEKVKLKFNNYLGDHGQQNFFRTTRYIGFEFTEPEKVDLKIWKRDSEHSTVFIPNRRTKAGREMAEFLANGLQKSDFMKPLNILGVNRGSRFAFPFIVRKENLILMWLCKSHEPKDENVIEITSKEYNSYFN